MPYAVRPIVPTMSTAMPPSTMKRPALPATLSRNGAASRNVTAAPGITIVAIGSIGPSMNILSL